MVTGEPDVTGVPTLPLNSTSGVRHRMSTSARTVTSSTSDAAQRIVSGRTAGATKG
ncbi:hypothetical protein ACO0LV_07190 [Pseudactinotalea sp. Z1739]|uniref:hypothetical protein n=1 Tax=Pseudactinotalea sp. Z1739 TaxID=3413028 RepID=UPI003C7BE1B6